MRGFFSWLNYHYSALCFPVSWWISNMINVTGNPSHLIEGTQKMAKPIGITESLLKWTLKMSRCACTSWNVSPLRTKDPSYSIRLWCIINHSNSTLSTPTFLSISVTSLTSSCRHFCPKFAKSQSLNLIGTHIKNTPWKRTSHAFIHENCLPQKKNSRAPGSPPFP